MPVQFTTSDGKPITPGLRVFTNNCRWGTVEATQFERGDGFAPGGEHFDGWFNVVEDNDLGEPTGGKTLLNGERMSTVKPAGLR